MSQVEEHFRYLDHVTAGNFAGAEAYRVLHGIELKDLCAPANKHCLTQPVYAAVKGVLYAGDGVMDNAMEYIKNAVDTVPGLMDIVNSRVNVLSYVTMNTDKPELAQFLIDQDPTLVNDQSRYDDNQTSEFGSTFKIYRPTYNSPTHEAAMHNRLGTLDVLIKNGADVNLKNIAGITPLDGYFYNCHRLDSKMVNMLLDAGGEVTSRGFSTPSLFYGIQNKCWSGVNDLLRESAVKVSQWYYKQIAENSVADGVFSKEAAKTLGLAADHVAADFDMFKFATEFCPTVMPQHFNLCKDTFNYAINMKYSGMLNSEEAESFEPTLLASNEDLLAHIASEL